MQITELAGQPIEGGKYVLKRLLGGGAFGKVYEAEQMMNGLLARTVAVKLYDPEATRLGRVEGMLEDCAMPARVFASNAPLEEKRHFVHIYDFGHADTPAGRCAYVAMELLRGTTFEALIDQCRLLSSFPPEETIVGYMRQFFTALRLAHSQGILHRDIKPANVMLTDGVVRVLDFGMGAYVSEPNAQLKTTMSIYAPENFEGRYTVTSDIYQAGLLFYELYTGFQPYAADRPWDAGITEQGKRAQFVFQPGDRFSEAHPSRLLDTVLSRCLAYGAAGRYQTAQQVLDALAGEDPLLTMRQALANGDAAFALSLAEETLAKGTQAKLDDVRRAEWLRALAEAQEAAGRPEDALATLKEALAHVEATRAYLPLPREWNALLDSISLLYIKKGQAGMARIFAKKKR